MNISKNKFQKKKYPILADMYILLQEGFKNIYKNI